jgi:hypothetical protein
MAVGQVGRGDEHRVRVLPHHSRRRPVGGGADQAQRGAVDARLERESLAVLVQPRLDCVVSYAPPRFG